MNFFSFFDYLNREVFTQDASYLPDTLSAFLSVIQTPLCKVVMWCFSLIFKAGIKEFYMVSTYCVDFLGIVLSFCCKYFTPAPTSQKNIIIAYLFFISFVIL